MDRALHTRRNAEYSHNKSRKGVASLPLGRHQPSPARGCAHAHSGPFAHRDCRHRGHIAELGRSANDRRVRHGLRGPRGCRQLHNVPRALAVVASEPGEAPADNDRTGISREDARPCGRMHMHCDANVRRGAHVWMMHQELHTLSSFWDPWCTGAAYPVNRSAPDLEGSCHRAPHAGMVSRLLSQLKHGSLRS